MKDNIHEHILGSTNTNKGLHWLDLTNESIVADSGVLYTKFQRNHDSVQALLIRTSFEGAVAGLLFIIVLGLPFKIQRLLRTRVG